MKTYDKLMEYLIYLYIIILPLAPSKFKVGPVPFNGDAVLALIILAYLIKITADRISRDKFIKGLKDFFTHSIGIAMALLIFIMFCSVLYSLDMKMAIKESARFTTYIILYFIIKYEVTGEKVKENIINLYFMVCFVVFARGIFEFSSAMIKTGAFVYTWELRAASTLENVNNLGTFAIIALFPAISLFLGEKTWKKKSFYGLIAFMAFANIIVSFSRNALLGFMIGCVLMAFLYSYKFIIAFIITVGAALIIPMTRTRILQLADMTQNESRIKVWKTAGYMIKDHPLLGVGNGNFYTQYGGYIEKHPELTNTYDYMQVFHPHNILLKIQSELGIIGTLAFLGIIVSVFRDLVRFLKSECDPFFRIFYKGFLVSAAVFMIMNLIDNFFSAPKVIAFFWIFIAIFQSLDYNGRKVG
ncbi:MAG: O-antigen ligase family protein [Clostridiaceae bacterium]